MRPSPAIGALDRASSFLHRIARAAGRLALVALLAGSLVWWALYRALEGGGGRTVGLAVAAVLLAAPPAVLGLFIMGVRALIELPRRLRETPGAFRERAGEIGRRATELSDARGQGVGRAVAALFRLGWAVASSRELMEVASPALALLTPWMLGATVLATVAAVVEILLGAVALIWLAAS